MRVDTHGHGEAQIFYLCLLKVKSYQDELVWDFKTDCSESSMIHCEDNYISRQNENQLVERPFLSNHMVSKVKQFDDFVNLYHPVIDG